MVSLGTMSRRFWATLTALFALTALTLPSAEPHPRASSAQRGAGSATRSEAPVSDVPAPVLSPETASRAMPPAPFGPAALSRLELAVVVVAASPAALVTRAPAVPSVVLPLSRAPPAHS